MTSIGIIGSQGRMGVALAAAISEAGQRSCGVDKGGDVARLVAAADVLVDFSSPGALEATLDGAARWHARATYERERAARLAATCRDCGNAALAGEPRCMTCELAAVQG